MKSLQPLPPVFVLTSAPPSGRPTFPLSHSLGSDPPWPVQGQWTLWLCGTRVHSPLGSWPTPRYPRPLSEAAPSQTPTLPPPAPQAVSLGSVGAPAQAPRRSHWGRAGWGFTCWGAACPSPHTHPETVKCSKQHPPVASVPRMAQAWILRPALLVKYSVPWSVQAGRRLAPQGCSMGAGPPQLAPHCSSLVGGPLPPLGGELCSTLRATHRSVTAMALPRFLGVSAESFGERRGHSP